MVPWESSALTVITWLTVFTSQLFFASRCYTLYGHSKLVFGALLFGKHSQFGEVKIIILALWSSNDRLPGDFPAFRCNDSDGTIQLSDPSQDR